MASDLKISERDTNQRSLGCIGFSVIAHFGLLGILLLTPSLHTELEGMAKGGGSTSQSIKVDMSTENVATEQSREVILADAKDETAIQLPQAPTRPPAQPPAQVPAQAPVQSPIAAQELPKPMKEKVKKAARKKKVATEAKPVLTEEKPDAPFQPESIADVDPTDKSKDPEALSPIITDNPPTEPSSDEPALTSAEPALNTASSEKPNDQVSNQPIVQPNEKEDTPATPSTSASEALTAPAAAAPADTHQKPSEGAGNGDKNGGGQQGPQNGGIAATGTGQSPMSEQVMDFSLRNPLSGNPLPTYPQQDQLTGRQGTAIVVGHVLPNGSVSDVVVDKSSGSAMMDRAAVDTFKNWKFAKGPEALVRKGFAFKLTGEPKLVRAKLGGR
jgi:protein TonB